MSGYGYAPPPPPPAAQSSHQGYRNQGSPYQRQGGPARGGAPPSRGRGGFQGPGRQDYHHPPPQYDYSSQPTYPAPASYAAAQPPTVNYGAHQQWSQDQRQPPPQPQPHAPAPLSSANYHPNYAHQHYGPAHPQAAAPQPGYAAPPPQSQSYQYAVPAASYGSHPAWHGHEQQQHAPQYGAHPRGGYGSDRGGSRAPSLGSHTRPEYGSPGMQPQVTGGYAPPQPYADPRASVPAYPPQPQYHYAPPPPPSHASPQGRDNHFKHDGHRGHHGGRGGRGGGRGGGNNHRGKPHHHAGGGGGGGGDRNRNRPNGPRPDHGNDHKHENQNVSGKKKKRKTNTLGLTPGQPGQESESEDDEKEEETLRKLLGQDALQVTDIASYVAERKKNFPTANRVKAKKGTEAASNTTGDKRATALEKQEKMAEKLRKQLEKVESSIKRKREQQDEGDEMRDSSASVKSDDEPPEAVSTRAQQSALQNPANRADVTRHCKYFSTGGTCGKKGKCRFVHDPEVRAAAFKEQEANNGQLTIQQRLILNDKDQEDLTVLQSIHYLREKGMIPPEEADAPRATNGSATTQSSLPQAHGLPAKPPSKRENRQTTREPPPSAIQMAKTGAPSGYKGWNLSGYGNSGLKSEDLP